MTDEEILAEIKRRLAEPIYLIGFIPMTFEQVERFFFSKPWNYRDDEVLGLSYWTSAARGKLDAQHRLRDERNKPVEDRYRPC